MTKTTGGDCYEAAVNFLWEQIIPGLGDPEFAQHPIFIVHGEVTGQGELEGVKFGHAWVEIGDTVFDVSNGKELVTRKELYYEIGNIRDEPGKLYRYNAKQARDWMVRLEHYGPWELITETGL